MFAAFSTIISLEDIYQEIQSSAIESILLSAFGFLFSLAVLYFFLHRMVIMPVTEVSKIARIVAKEGNLVTRVRVKSGDEIGDLAESFNEMTESLSRTLVSKAYVDNVITSITDALIVINSDASIRTINKATEKLLGYREDELIGKLVEMLFPEEEKIRIGTHLKKILNEGSVRDCNTACRTKSGENIPVNCSCSAIREEAGDLEGIVVIARDLRDVKKMENQAKETQSQLVHAGRLASLGEMAAGIAHELNQPLATIRSNIQGLEWDLKYNVFSLEKIPGLVAGTLKQVDRAAYIIDHMRIFARTHVSSSAPLDVRKPILAGLSMFAEQFRLHDIAIETQFEENLPLITANSQQFEQIVVNFLSNARFAVEKKSKESDSTYLKKIIFRLYNDVDRNFVVLEVIDNGVGMDAEVLQHCVEPFYTTKDVGEGTGLGLSITYGIIKDFGGNLEVESSPGHGSTFRVFLKIENSKKEVTPKV